MRRLIAASTHRAVNLPSNDHCHRKSWLSYLHESPTDRANRLNVKPDELVQVDQIKTAFKCTGTDAATLFHAMNEHGLIADGGLPHLVRYFNSHAEIATPIDAIPAYCQFRKSLVPVTKDWLNIHLFKAPLLQILMPHLSDQLEPLILSTSPPLSQNDLVPFLKTHSETIRLSILKTPFISIDTADWVVSHIIQIARECAPNWHLIQDFPNLDAGLSAHSNALTNRIKSAWTRIETQITSLATELVLTKPEAQYCLLGLQTDPYYYETFIRNQLEPIKLAELNPDPSLKVCITHWFAVRDKFRGPKSSQSLPLILDTQIDDTMVHQFQQRLAKYTEAGLRPTDFRCAEMHLYAQFDATTHPKTAPSQLQIDTAIEHTFLNRYPRIPALLPIWRQHDPSRSIRALSELYTELLALNLMSPLPHSHPPDNTPHIFTPSPSDTSQRGTPNFDIKFILPPYLDVAPQPLTFVFELQPEPQPASPSISLKSDSLPHHAAHSPIHSDQTWNDLDQFQLILDLQDRHYTLPDIRRLLVEFPTVTPHRDDQIRLESLYQTLNASTSAPWPVSRIIEIAPVFNDLHIIATLPENTLIAEFIKLGPTRSPFETQINTICDAHPEEAHRAIKLTAYYRLFSQLGNLSIPAITKQIHHYVQLRFSLHAIVQCEQKILFAQPDQVPTITRGVFFRSVSQDLSSAMEAQYLSLARSDHNAPGRLPLEYQAAEIVLGDHRSEWYRTNGTSPLVRDILEMIVQHDTNTPHAISDSELLRDTNTIQTIIQSNDTQWRVALRNLAVPDHDIDTAVRYIRPHFTAEVYRDAYHPTGATRTFLFPNAERYQSLTHAREDSPFTRGLRDYIDDQIATHRGTLRELGFHPEDADTLLRCLNSITITTPFLRANAHRLLEDHLDAFRQAQHQMTTSKLPPHDGPSPLYDTPFSEFPIQENESKTAHTARFKTQLLLDLVGNIRIIEYDKLKLSADEIHKLEQIEVPVDYLPPIEPTPLQPLSVHQLRAMDQLVCATADPGQRLQTRSPLRPYSDTLTPITTDQLDAAIQRGIRHKDWAQDIRQHDVDIKKFEDAGISHDDALLAYEMYTNESQAFSHGVYVYNGYHSEASFQLVLEKVKLSRFRPQLRQELTSCYFAARDRFIEYKKAGIWWEGKYDIDLFYGDLSTRDPDGKWNIQTVISRFHDTYHRYKYYQSEGVKIEMLPYVDTFWKPEADPKTALQSYYYEIGKYETVRQAREEQELLDIKPVAPEPMTREESYQLAKDLGYTVKWDSSANDYTYVDDEPILTIFAPENPTDYKPDEYNYSYAERHPDLTLGISDYYREKEARIHREIGQNGGYMVYF